MTDLIENAARKAFSQEVKDVTLDIAKKVAKQETAITDNTIAPEYSNPRIDKVGEEITGNSSLITKYNRLAYNMPPQVKQVLSDRVRGESDIAKKIKIADSLYKEYKIKPLEDAEEKTKGAKAIAESFNIAKESIANDINVTKAIGDPLIVGNDQFDYEYIQEKTKDIFGREIINPKRVRLTEEQSYAKKKKALDDALFNKQILEARQQNIGDVSGAEELLQGASGLVGSSLGFATEGVKLYGPAGVPAATMAASYLQGKGDILLNLHEDGVDVIRDKRAQAIASTGGAIYGSLEKLQLGKLFGVKKVAGKTIAGIISKGLKEYGEDVATNVMQEGLQQVTTTMSEDIAKMKASGLSEKQIMEFLTKNTGRYVNEFKSQIETAGAFALVGAPGKVMGAKKSIAEISTPEAKGAINVQEAKQILQQNKVNPDQVVRIVEGIKTPSGVNAEGVVLNDAIQLIKSASSDKVGAHEAFHYLAKRFGDSDVYQNAIKEIMEREGTNQDNAEEKLANEFSSWRKTRASESGLAVQLFSDMSNNIKGLFSKNKESMKLYNAFNYGKLEAKAPSVIESVSEKGKYKRKLSKQEQEAVKLIKEAQKKFMRGERVAKVSQEKAKEALVKRSKELGQLRGAILERTKQEKVAGRLGEKLTTQKEKTAIAKRTGQLQGLIKGKQRGFVAGKKAQRELYKFNKIVGNARSKVYMTIRDLKKRLKNNTLNVKSAKQIVELLSKYMDAGLIRNVMSLEAEYAQKTSSFTPKETIIIRGDGSVWSKDVTDNKIRKQELMKILNKLSDQELFQLYNDISYLQEVGKLEREAELEEIQQEIAADTDELTAGINEAAVEDLFKVQADVKLFQSQIDMKELSDMRTIEGITEQDEDVKVGKARKIGPWTMFVHSVRQSKRVAVNGLNPMVITEMLDVNNKTVHDFYWKQLVRREHLRDTLIKEANLVWKNAFLEFSKKHSMAEFTPFTDQKEGVVISLNPLESIMLSLYLDNDHSRDILLNNNAIKEKVSEHNRITPGILDAVNNMVNSNPEYIELKKKIGEAVNKNSDLLFQVAEENNIMSSKQDNYMSYALETKDSFDAEKDVDNYADTLFDQALFNEDRQRSRSSMLKERQKHSKAIRIKDVDFAKLIERTIESQARFIAFEPIYKSVKSVTSNVKSVLYNKYKSNYIWSKVNSWVNDVLFGEEYSMTPGNKFLRDLRKRTYAAKLWWNVKSILRQLNGIFVAQSRVGGKEVYNGLKLARNKSQRDFAFKKSNVLSTRLVNFDQADFEKTIEGKPLAKIIEGGIKGLTYSDSFVATAVWLGAYNSELNRLKSELGSFYELNDEMFDEAAIDYADQAVAYTQNMSSTLFKPSFVRNDELMKSIFMYGSQGFQVYSAWRLYKLQLKAKKITPLEYFLKVLFLIWIPSFFNRMIDNGSIPINPNNWQEDSRELILGAYADLSPSLNKIYGAIQYDKSLTEAASLGFFKDLTMASKYLIMDNNVDQAVRYGLMGAGQPLGINTHLIDTAIIGAIDIATGKDTRLRRLIYRSQSLPSKRITETRDPKSIASIVRKSKSREEIDSYVEFLKDSDMDRSQKNKLLKIAISKQRSIIKKANRR